MSFKSKLSAFLTVATMLAAGFANATVVTVDSNANSFVGGTALNTGVTLNANETFFVVVDPLQIWNFGGGNPSYNSNADGWNGSITDITNPDGTTFHGAFAGLFGQIGNGNYFNVGTNFAGFANASGELKFFYLDSDAWNNIGAVEANITVPEPATLGLMGLGLLVLARRRRA